jgi:nucleotide-binding universal stress UspA family protein
MTRTLPFKSTQAKRPTPVRAARPLAQTYDPAVRGAVLLATDGRGETDATLRAAAAVAARLETSVEVVGVLDPFPGFFTAMETTALSPVIEASRRTAILESIEGRLNAVGGGAERWPVTVVIGEAGWAVSDRARTEGSSVIVVGTGRHEGRGPMSGAERAVRIVRSADRPVLIVRPDFAGLPTTAVVGMDFSPASVRAAHAALRLLADGGRLVLLHVAPSVELPAMPLAAIIREGSFEPLYAGWREKRDGDVATLFERLLEELRPSTARGVTVETRSRVGDVLTHLISSSDEVGAEMLAIGTHGPGIIERMFLGSVAINALREADRTVLVAPAPDVVESGRLELRLRGTTETRHAADWGPLLDAFSKRNEGRPARLDVDDPHAGARTAVNGYGLFGVAYDAHDESTAIMLGASADRVRHVTHSVPLTDFVVLYAAPDGRDQALRLSSGRAEALLTFLD